MTANAPPLEGVRVLDLTQIMAGPYCAMTLGDMGADVVKVEKPNGGDDARRMGPPFIEGESAAFLGINRNKRSIVADMRTDGGREIVQELARRSDILIQNFRPGSLERMGLGYEQVREINPAIIYCTISGFGATGPYARRGGFDLVAQGMSGLMSVTGHPGAPPTKIGAPICDLNAGMFAAIGILTAYVNRLRTGTGQHVDTSLLEGGIAYTFWESAMYFATGEPPGPMGSAHRLTAPYQAFETADGYINVGAANQANWERLCAAIGRDELGKRPALHPPARPHGESGRAGIHAGRDVRARDDRAHWLTALEAAGVPAGPIYTLDEVYADPQVRARDMVVETEHPAAGRVSNIGIPVKLSETPGAFRRPAPALGEHTDEVLRELGVSDARAAALRASGAVA